MRLPSMRMLSLELPSSRTWLSTSSTTRPDAVIAARSCSAVLEAVSNVSFIVTEILPILCVMREPMSADSSDSLRTSAAMTANPRPAGPARAASIEALMANRLVWAAICLTSSDRSFNSPVATTNAFTLSSNSALLPTIFSRHLMTGLSSRSHNVKRLIVTSLLAFPRAATPVKPAESNCFTNDENPASNWEMAVSVWSFTDWTCRCQTGSTPANRIPMSSDSASEGSSSWLFRTACLPCFHAVQIVVPATPANAIHSNKPIWLKSGRQAKAVANTAGT